MLYEARSSGGSHRQPILLGRLGLNGGGSLLFGLVLLGLLREILPLPPAVEVD